MYDKQTILVVDDTETNIDTVIGFLYNEYDVVVTTDGFVAIEIANSEEVDLILLDIMMPKINGFDVCKKLKENPKTKDIPIIFLTAKLNEESIEKAYDMGGVDYISKPFKPKELIARVRTHLQIKNLISNLEFLASRDSMTGIYNRRKFFELAEELLDSNNFKNIFAIMIDIDKFKQINDTFGHPIGDEVIKLLVKTINSDISDSDIFARLGGEEFVILTCDKTIDSLLLKLESIRKEIERLKIETSCGVVKFTISLGVTEFTQEIKTIDELLKIADESLYIAKDSGRNRINYLRDAIN